MLKKPLMYLILTYKRTLSHVIGRNCSYIPTCSMYTYDALDKYGAIVGLLLGVLRVFRCHPYCKGGFDPVKENLGGKAKWTL